MKIGIDALYLQFADSPVGLYQYTLRLVHGLQEIDRKNEYALYFFNWRNRKREETIKSYSFNPNFEKRICRIPSRALAPLSTFFPISAILGKVDVLHGPSFRLLPRGCYKRSVVTIHDLKFIRHPEWHAGGLDFIKPTRDAVERADRIVAVSDYTRRELMEVFHLSSDRIQVIHPGIGKEFTPSLPPERIEAVKSKYGIKNSYILFVGLMEEKKNLIRLVEAFSQIRRALPGPYQLVLAGPTGPATEKVVQTITAHSLGGEVLLPGAVSREDLPFLYAGAAVFAFPSLQEGFGIPPLEAMASGIPVVASNVSSLPEVIGEGGLLIDPLKTEAIAEALYKVLTEEPLRERLKEKGLERAKSFSWDKMAREMLDLYETL
jgi:glycosyltransferase involved in cell wall biosynthesis